MKVNAVAGPRLCFVRSRAHTTCIQRTVAAVGSFVQPVCSSLLEARRLPTDSQEYIIRHVREFQVSKTSEAGVVRHRVASRDILRHREAY